MAARHDPKSRSARAVESFQSLHKNLGVQQSNLYDRLGPELRALWRIGGDDLLSDVRRKVIAALQEVVAEVGSGEDLETVVSYRYNYSLPPEVSKLALGTRELRLQRLKGPGFSPRNVLRIIKPFQEEMRKRLTRPLPLTVDTTAPEGLATPVAETRVPGSGRPTRTRLATSVRRMNSPAIALVDEALRNFLSGDVYEPRPAGGRVIVNTETGDWLCVFSDVDRLTVYRDAVGADWSHPPLAKTGREIILEIVRSGQRVGILCDPSPRLGGSSQETLMLPPDEVWRLGGTTTG